MKIIKINDFSIEKIIDYFGDKKIQKLYIAKKRKYDIDFHVMIVLEFFHNNRNIKCALEIYGENKNNFYVQIVFNICRSYYYEIMEIGKTNKRLQQILIYSFKYAKPNKYKLFFDNCRTFVDKISYYCTGKYICKYFLNPYSSIPLFYTISTLGSIILGINQDIGGFIGTIGGMFLVKNAGTI